MKYQKKQSALLVLEDGTVFKGKAIGVIGTTTGEIAFNTGMTGYQEIFTDPSYFGQIVIMTTSHIGNYGINNEEIESGAIKIAGLVCKKFSETYSREAADSSLQQYFERDGLVGISDIDTRALVRHIRSKGAMNAIISSEILDSDLLVKNLNNVPSMEGLELASKVTTKEEYVLTPDKPNGIKVALLDFGVKKNIERCLLDRGCEVKVFPKNTSLDIIMKYQPNGIMLSNGPGDPSTMKNEIEEVEKIIASNIPTFGICLGHQLLALSQGLSTFKMHNGHRGINHPIKNIGTNRGEITSQNHGFAVSMESAQENSDIEVTHVHLNDGTLAGLKVKSKNAFSVQYHPESSPGPHDSRYLFDEFVTAMETAK